MGQALEWVSFRIADNSPKIVAPPRRRPQVTVGTLHTVHKMAAKRIEDGVHLHCRQEAAASVSKFPDNSPNTKAATAVTGFTAIYGSART